MGPTGVGKSDLAIWLAQKFNGEIISADSVQVFRRFNIGSAKIKPEETQGIQHHCIDILDPNEQFSVYEFVEITKKLIDEIVSRDKLPIVVGGTGLYVKALTQGYDFGGTGKQTERREELNEILRTQGIEPIYERLKSMAPEIAEQIPLNNHKRIIRALELCEAGQKPNIIEVDIDAKIFALNMPRENIYERINLRVDKMLEEGLVDEVKGLLIDGVNRNAQGLGAIGYKEVVQYLDKEISYERMVELIKQHTRNYAKRQLTFCRGIDGLEFVDVTDREEAKTELILKIEEWL